MSLTSFVLALRLARREVVRRPWRTLLVALLVAGPVAGMTVAVTFARTEETTAIQVWQWDQGAADAIVVSDLPASGEGPAVALGPGPAGQTLGPDGRPLVLSNLPPGSRFVGYQRDWRLVRTNDGRRVRAEISNLPLGDSLTDGMLTTRGRAPETANEVTLSQHAAAKLGAHIGGTLDLDTPIDATVTVVGISEYNAYTNGDLVVLHPSAIFPPVKDGFAPTQYLVDLPAAITPSQVAALAAAPSTVLSPRLAPRTGEDYTSTDMATEVRWSWFIGAIVLTVVGIVIASAFAAGARRQLTMLGQLSANGASSRTVRRILMLQGTWTGLVGAVVGLGLGAAALAGLTPYRDGLFGRHITAYQVRATDLGPIVILGIAAATVAALLPARTASRIPVLAALAGRRPLGAVPRWLTGTGLGLGAGGLVLMGLATAGATGGGDSNGTIWALTGMTGGVILLLGVCAVAPGYVSVLGPIAARMGGSWRLAARSLARQRSRTGAVVSSVCVTAALAVAASTVTHAIQANDARSQMPANLVVVASHAYRSTPNTMLPNGLGEYTEVITTPSPEVIGKVRAILPEAQVTQQMSVLLNNDSSSSAAIADATLVNAYGYGPEVKTQLKTAGIVVLVSEPIDGPRPRDIILEPGSVGVGRTADLQQFSIEVPVRATKVVDVAKVNDPQTQFSFSPNVLISPEKASELGLVPVASNVVLRQAKSLSADQRTSLDSLTEEQFDSQEDSDFSLGPTPYTNFAFYGPSLLPNPAVIDAALAGIALVFTLFVVATSLALAAAETRDERDVLTIVGASPRTIRRSSGIKAVVVTAFGTVLALPVGLLPVLVFTRVDRGDIPFLMPWPIMGLLVIAVPLLAGLTTTSASALGLWFRPVRTSTMTFE